MNKFVFNSLIYNVNRQQDQVRLFETGLCFSQVPNQSDLTFDDIDQVRKLAGVAAGRRESESWANSAELIDFFDIKGDLESVLALSGEPEAFVVSAGEHPALHLGQSASIEKSGENV